MFKHIFHSTDFSDASHTAFVHALKIALAARGDLTVLHVVAHGSEGSSSGFPHVRRTLAAWGLVGPDCQRDETAALGIRIRKLEIADSDLIVMTTRGPQGFLGALRGSTTSNVIRACACPLLAVPRD
jgi:nucleotide-binding universal stress UspA family protein